MSITPQAIKDQEFQIKFRGYDAVEVKAYLDLLAEEFFELHEGKRRQEEEYADLYEENQALKQEKDTLAQDALASETNSENAVKEQKQKDATIAELNQKVSDLEGTIGTLQQEQGEQLAAQQAKENELADEVELLKERLQAKQQAVSEANNQAEKLRHQVELLEKQIMELKKDEADFKSTILAAQNFADDLRQKSETEAEEMMAKAREEVESYRQKAEEELAKLPLEIEALRAKRENVREELRTMLNEYLAQLDTFTAAGAGEQDEELDDLFQSISLPEEGASEHDDLDNINMELT